MGTYDKKGPTMVDLDMFIQAGINPKTGLPIKATTPMGLEYNLKPEIKKSLRIMDEQDAVNRFVWHNLPNGLNGHLIERILYYKGQAAFFYMPTDNKFYFLPYALDGNIDVYGRYIGITPLPFAGGTTTGSNKPKEEKPWITGLHKTPVYNALDFNELTVDMFDDSCVLLNDYTPQLSQTVIPRANLQDVYVDMMAECLPFARTALLSGTGIEAIRVQSEDEQSNVDAASRSINKAALYGQKFIPIVGQLEFQELTNGNIAKAEEYLLTMQSIDNLRLSLYGLGSGGLFEKKAHMLQTEANQNSSNTALILQDGLTNRQRFCDIINSIWGLGIWVESSEVSLGADKDANGIIEDDFAQDGAPGEQTAADIPTEEENGGNE